MNDENEETYERIIKMTLDIKILESEIKMHEKINRLLNYQDSKFFNKRDTKKLKTTLTIYRSIQLHPYCTKEDIVNDTMLPERTIKRYLKHMKNSLLPYVETIKGGRSTNYIVCPYSNVKGIENNKKWVLDQYYTLVNLIVNQPDDIDYILLSFLKGNFSILLIDDWKN